ncbi:thermonuclease family protein [Yoonia sp. 2307UL14-13]|uniref:thermonuclease family protein n=1 Tax=Yoonia sp. 2307UL14-13 TaxID=3126506 RepID=UPI0030EF6A07
MDRLRHALLERDISYCVQLERSYPPVDVVVHVIEFALEVFLLFVGLGVIVLLRRKRRRRGQRIRVSTPGVQLPRRPVRRTISAVDNRPKPPVSNDREPPQEKVLLGRAYVTDGDGLRIKGQEIRLFGIDAPEFEHPYGKKAKWALHGLCKGRDVMAVSADIDDYGRLVARCYLSDGSDLSAEMVKLGLALDWPKFSGGIYSHLETADARRKLWLADARQKGRMDVWEKYEAKRAASGQNVSPGLD